MKIEQNTLSRDWHIQHAGRTFFVNFTESDGQTLALLNRDNWEVYEETEAGTELLDIYVFSDSTPAQREQAAANARLAERLIRFCLDSWDDEFMADIERGLADQKELLRCSK